MPLLAANITRLPCQPRNGTNMDYATADRLLRAEFSVPKQKRVHHDDVCRASPNDQRGERVAYRLFYLQTAQDKMRPKPAHLRKPCVSVLKSDLDKGSCSTQATARKPAQFRPIEIVQLLSWNHPVIKCYYRSDNSVESFTAHTSKSLLPEQSPKAARAKGPRP